jgi:predicted amidohydrolase
MLRKIGFFHFAENHGDPFGELELALPEFDDSCDSLIVLPEAFNNGRSYYDTPRGQPIFGQGEAVDRLARLSEERRIVFVAALLDPPRSSAYLIDRSGARLICHKKSDDCSGNYEPYEANCDPANPIDYQDACIGVLICKDIQEGHAELLVKGVRKRTSTYKVICVPACMDDSWFGVTPDRPHLGSVLWTDMHLIVANSNPAGCWSFMTNPKREAVPVPARERNQIILRTWAELDRIHVADQSPR